MGIASIVSDTLNSDGGAVDVEDAFAQEMEWVNSLQSLHRNGNDGELSDEAINSILEKIIS